MVYIFLLLFTACGKFESINTPADSDAWIVKAKATIDINFNKFNAYQSVATIPVTVTVASSTTFVLNTTSFNIPAITTTDTLTFGSLTISTLRDNNLKVCGPLNNQKCTQAAIRIYSQGVAGDGLWNATEGYGAPLNAQLGTSAPQMFGLFASNVIMQSYTIPANKHVLKLNDFSPSPNYNITSDFSNAGAGNYSTSIVIEYIVQ